MLDAVHDHTAAEYSAEHLEFRATEALAGGSGGADRAMVLEQQECIAGGAPFGHVTFARANPCQPCHAGTQGAGVAQRRCVGASGLGLPRAYEPLQCLLAERRAHRLDQAHGKLGVGIGEAPVSRLRQVPNSCRAADATLPGDAPDQAIIRQLHQVLPRGLGRRAENDGDVGRPQRPAPLDQPEDPIGRVLQAHACILRPGRGVMQAWAWRSLRWALPPGGGIEISESGNTGTAVDVQSRTTFLAAAIAGGATNGCPAVGPRRLGSRHAQLPAPERLG
jgi:hypothetical protein